MGKRNWHKKLNNNKDLSVQTKMTTIKPRLIV